ncbi:hypothetical protein PACTADRAFT_74177 [Pachysolen tannophilus NRRL Y-2460]|uniref:Fe2OG dioxygenase domain-containing protein n=1 Tax=Pachysolen tannophilus NRRL Y-2460 TaxID=669874 RepID=A0A1E4TXS2_PACTA|nr:hypothetical protein PACTADRAFT_74177 [Pachysolen tannophilus NRRL Y-2460]
MTITKIPYIDEEYQRKVNEKYNVRPFVHVKPTKENIPTVKVDSLDISQFKDGSENFESRKKLADQLEKSIRTYGFFYLTGHGIEKSLNEKLHAIAQSVMEIPEEEKIQYYAGAKTTDEEDRDKYMGGERGNGYKPKGYWGMQSGVRDAICHYNLRDLLQPEELKKHKQPEIVTANLDSIITYYDYIHNELLRKLTILCDIILEIPEGTLWENFFKIREGDIERSGFGWGRFMMYYGMSSEDEKKTKNTWLRGHSDSTAFTFIYSQPMTSLQLRDYYTGDWKYVDYMENAYVCNVGDALEFLTGAYFKSTIHRVVKPPQDQQNHRRLGLIYFADPAPYTVIDPETLDSPKLKRLGYNKPKEWEKITFGQWDSDKDRFFGKAKLYSAPVEEPTPVLIYGRYNERWHQSDKEHLKFSQNSLAIS